MTNAEYDILYDLWEEVAPRIIELKELSWRTPDEIEELKRLESLRQRILNLKKPSGDHAPRP